MYYPYFRGKQFELITIRESAQLLAKSSFVPIIEPVRESLAGLKKTLSAICDAGGKAIVIINPYHGDHNQDGTVISTLIKDGPFSANSISAGILLRSDSLLDEAIATFESHKGQNPALIHAGFTAAKPLAAHLKAEPSSICNVFIEKHAELLYRKHFEGSTRVLIRDGFKRGRNADYPPLEVFSELHVTYTEMGLNAFGDFLVVGDEYSEGGGPAYAVAIHITFIDPDKDDTMFIYHFVSDSKDTPTDPAGKFGQALSKLVETVDRNPKVLETSAIQELRELHAKGHFPGLGYVKKLSMKHHIETLARYLG